jgi:hypothetical protein
LQTLLFPNAFAPASGVFRRPSSFEVDLGDGGHVSKLTNSPGTEAAGRRSNTGGNDIGVKIGSIKSKNASNGAGSVKMFGSGDEHDLDSRAGAESADDLGVSSIMEQGICAALDLADEASGTGTAADEDLLTLGSSDSRAYAAPKMDAEDTFSGSFMAVP